MLICLTPFSFSKILTNFFPKCPNSKCPLPTGLDGDRKGRCGERQQAFLPSGLRCVSYCVCQGFYLGYLIYLNAGAFVSSSVCGKSLCLH